MNGRWRQSGLRLLLATLLVGRFLSPPGYCHAHADGRTPHRHDANRAGHHHAHRHHDADHLGRDRPARHSHGDGQWTAADAVPHVHVSVFGFEITLPISDPVEQNGPSDPHDGLSLVVIVAADPAITVPAGNLLRSPCLLPPALPEGLSYAADDPPRRVMSAASSSIPLCDSARGERSGVLIV